MSVELLVDGRRFAGWQSISIDRGIEQMAGGFDLEVTDKWNSPTGIVAAEIRDGLACRVTVQGQVVVTGYIDEVNRSYDSAAHAIRVTGRDKAGDLVDCSAIHKSGAWRNKTVAQIAADLCAPFGIGVTVAASVGAPLPAFSIQEGETVYEALERAAKMRALLVVSDGLGNIQLTRAGTGRAPADLVEGQNILRAEGKFSQADRYSDYIVKGQAQGDDHTHGAAVAHPSAAVKDAGIARYRPLIVLAEDQGANASFAERAEWERNVRTGRAIRATVTVNGWTANGKLWHPNTLTRLRSPLLGADHDLLIVSVRYALDSQSGELTALELAPPAAYATIAEEDAGGKRHKKKKAAGEKDNFDVKLNWDWSDSL